MRLMRLLAAGSVLLTLTATGCGGSPSGNRTATPNAFTTTVGNVDTTSSSPAPLIDTTSTTTITTESPPADWRNHTYDGLCTPGSITLVDGSTHVDEDLTVTAVEGYGNASGGIFVAVTCDFGATSAMGHQVALVNADNTNGGVFDIGTNGTVQTNSDGTLTATLYDWAASDPHCCPSLTSTVVLSSSNGRLVSSGPVEVVPTSTTATSSEMCVHASINPYTVQGPDRDVMALQAGLLHAGFDPGDIDGYYGPNTSSAVTAYASSITGDMPYNLIWIDEGAIVYPLFARLGVACPDYRFFANEPTDPAWGQ